VVEGVGIGTGLLLERSRQDYKWVVALVRLECVAASVAMVAREFPGNLDSVREQPTLNVSCFP
jgi:hypothetical protein